MMIAKNTSNESRQEKFKSLASQESVLVCMYGGLPEPPTLNAILVLAQYFKSVTMLRTNLNFPAEGYPSTPELHEVGARYEVKEAAAKGFAWKMGRFGRYCLAMHSELKSGKYKLIIIHDYLGLLAFWLVKKWSGYKGLSWFNSYDAIDHENHPVGKFSLMQLVIKKHAELFRELDFFSLPAAERKKYYPLSEVKKATYVVPNFPSIHFYQPYFQPRKISEQPVIKLIYQGALGEGHGYEDIINILHKTVRGRSLQLILKGWIHDEYNQELIKLAEERGVADKLLLPGFSFYRDLPKLTAACTIGLAIYTKQDIMNQTVVTASNKIYEYIAVGLPVVMFDAPIFREYHGDKSWAYFTDLSEQSLLSMIEEIVDNYDSDSLKAHESFMEDYNYEKIFAPVLHEVIQAMHPNKNV